jgi:hypothetical protein
VYGRRYEAIELAVLKALCSHHERAYGIFAAYIGKHTRLDGHFFFPAGKDVDLLRVELCKILCAGKIELVIGYLAAVEIDHLVGCEHHGGADIEYAVVGQGLNNKFGAYTIQVAAGYANNRFVVHVLDVLFMLLNKRLPWQALQF